MFESDTFWAIFAPLWTLLCICFWVFIIRLIVKKVKKKKAKSSPKKLDGTCQIVQFRFLSFVNQYPNTSFCNKTYTAHLEAKKINMEDLNTVLSGMENFKAKFSTSLAALCSLSQENICLFTDEKFNALTPPPTDEQISKSIIELLPKLGEFFDIHHQLYEVLYWQIFTERIFPTNRQLLGVLYEDENSFEDHEEVKSSLMKYIKLLYQDAKDLFVKDICEGQENLHDLVLSYIEENDFEENMVGEFLKLYMSNMREAILPFIEANQNLISFFDEKQEEIKTCLPWLNFNRITLPNSSLCIDTKTKDECLRILDLYTSKKMSGSYSSFAERKSLEV